jgi:hypothetical protein
VIEQGASNSPPRRNLGSGIQSSVNFFSKLCLNWTILQALHRRDLSCSPSLDFVMVCEFDISSPVVCTWGGRKR